MRYFLEAILAGAVVVPAVTAAPAAASRHGRVIVDTTTLPNGQVIDWVLPDTSVAKPPSRSHPESDSTLSSMITPLNGPKGAVPYLRPNPSNGIVQKQFPTENSHAKRQIPDGHKYAFTGQTVNNIGGGAAFSLYDPYLESPNDFSLIQTAVSHTNVQNSYWGSITQTVEAGWQKYPAYSPQDVHFFTFFNTNGYNGDGDNLAGYNTDYKGWVQVDSTIYPGYQFRPLSVDGGAQHDITLEYELHNGQWWLSVGSTWIGYYPATLFNQNVTSGASLSTVSNEISFYGEMYSDDAQTTSDMGSGEFPSAGSNKAAYMRNVVYLDTAGTTNNYNAPSSANIVTDPNSYQLETHYNSGTSWNSYVLLGGPGYGGNVGS